MLTGTGVVERVYRSSDAVVVELAASVKAAAAKQFIREQLRWLARIAEECDRPHTVVRHCSIKPRKVPASMATPALPEYEPILMPNLIGQIPLFPAARRALDVIMENPGEKWFLHRVTPDFNSMVQIAISEAARSLIVGATLEQAIGRKRSDYMLPDELETMQRRFRQDAGVPIEHSFVLFSPVTRSDWRRMAYRYEIVGTLPSDELLQLGRCDGVEQVAAPVRGGRA